MTLSPAVDETTEKQSKTSQILQAILLAGCAVLLCAASFVDLPWPQQAVFGLVLLGAAVCIHHGTASYLATLMLMLLSCYATLRYGFWRLETLTRFFSDPATGWTALDAFFVAVLFLAECYAFVSLLLGYLQTLWPLRRRPVPLPADPDLWPHVDLLIPTYNEPLSVVKYTALAAINIDWPVDRLHVYILDDGRREEFRVFCEQAGIGYVTRRDHRFAKAGNINHALEQMSSPFVAIFDSDHVPTRSFLQLTMGWFGRDSRLAMLQTPHHLYSPDPFERNLNQFRVVPNEGELFYGVVQDGNDFWNSTFFCGSCAVMRRSALDEVGGIAVESVTEDAHTSLRMQKKGWNTAYINIPQAAGLATERLSSHIRQRIRWARGMVQVLRIENPLFAPGLSAAQRLCYFNAMSHFLYALPRLIFLTAPLIYLLFGHVNVPGYWAAVLAYAVPHLLISSVERSRVQGQHRHSFWNEIYETVLAPYIFLPTMLALVYPRFGRFQVTAKGGVVRRSFFDVRIAKPFLLLLLLNGLGLLCAIPRLLPFPYVSGLGSLTDRLLSLPANMYDGAHPGTVWMNVAWTIFNLTVLGVATAVARESQQRRQTVRVSMTVPATVLLPRGTQLQGATTDVSSGGVMIRSQQPLLVRPGDPVRLIFPVLEEKATLPATVVGVDGNVLRAHFDPLTLEQEEALTMMLYSRADTWLGWGEARESDRPFLSMLRIVQLSAHGLSTSVRSLFQGRRAASRYAGLMLVLAVLTARLAMPLPVQAQQTAAPAQALISGNPAQKHTAPAGLAPNASGAGDGVTTGAQFNAVFTLGEAGVPRAIVLRGARATRSVRFALPASESVASAALRLDYSFAPNLQAGTAQLLVELNGTQVAAIPVPAQVGDSGATQATVPHSATIPVPATLLGRWNDLRLEFLAQDPHCAAGESTAWVRVESSSAVQRSGTYLSVPNQLQQLPLPFYDRALFGTASLPIVFLHSPSLRALQAAGVVASWFGVFADARSLRIPVSVGTIPPGNVVLLAEDAADLPASLELQGVAGPTIAVRDNPSDSHSKVLILAGGSPEELLTAARVLALEHGQLSGATARGLALHQPHVLRQPDDAPRWLPTAWNTPLGNLVPPRSLQGSGESPIELTLRLAPDLYFGPRQNLPLQLRYRYNGVPLGNQSTLNLDLNGEFISATPMPHTSSASSDLETVVPVPVASLHPYENTLEARFLFDTANGAGCGARAPGNLQGVILKDSFLDLKNLPHWAVLPNLELFANAGYPFTRMADLSQTAVVLPSQPDAEIAGLYLTLMAYMGAQTGFPAVNLLVTDAAGMAAGKELLVLGALDNMPALERLQDKLPVQIEPDGLRVQDTAGFVDAVRRSRWWRLGATGASDAGALQIDGGVPDAVLEGLRWHGHSVVVVALRDSAEAQRFLPAFLQASSSSDIAQSVSVLNEAHFTSYRIGLDSYHVGTLSWWAAVGVFAVQNPWLLLLGVTLCCFVSAVLLRAMLRRHARRRLQISA